MPTNIYISNFYSNQIEEVKILMRNLISEKNYYIELMLKSAPLDNGKFLRALFVLIGCGFSDYKDKKSFQIALGIELMHLATLIHDDIIDESKIRRGKDSIHIKYGVKNGLFIGDYFFAQSYILLSKNSSLKGIEEVSNTIKTICKSEMLQFKTAFNLNQNIKNDLRRIYGKCAALFELSLKIGAQEFKVEEKTIYILSKIGKNLGMAFQMQDDLFDIFSNQKILGKPSDSDLKNGIYSFSVIWELQNSNEKLKNLLENNEFEKAYELLKYSEGVLVAKKVLNMYIKKACQWIEKLPDKEEKFLLKEIVENLKNRNF